MPTTPTVRETSLSVFETYKQAINTALEAYLQELPKHYAATDLPAIASQALAYLTEYTLRPGKRVRGALAAMAYDNLTAQALSPTGLRLAVVMELLQSYILIVDDVTDKSDLRRGEPTVHKMYEASGKGKTGPREAEQLAFYTGLVTGHIAQMALLEAEETPEHLAQV